MADNPIWSISGGRNTPGSNTTADIAESGVALCLLPACDEKYVQELTYRRRARKEQRLPDDEERLAQTPPRYVTVQDIRHTLRRQYGRFWGRKIRILLITGTASEVELLTPGLTEQFWQEEQGTLLLWGGEPSQPENADWLNRPGNPGD